MGILPPCPELNILRRAVKGYLYAVLYNKWKVRRIGLDAEGDKDVDGIPGPDLDIMSLRSRRSVDIDGKECASYQLYIGQTQFLVIGIDHFDDLGDATGGDKYRIEEQGVGAEMDDGILTGDKTIFPAGKKGEGDEQRYKRPGDTHRDKCTN